MADLTINVRQKILLQVAALRDDNVRVPTTDIPIWSSSNPAVAEIADVAPNGASATVKGFSVGLVTITVTADTFMQTIDVDVIAAPAPVTTGLVITPDMARDR